MFMGVQVQLECIHTDKVVIIDRQYYVPLTIFSNKCVHVKIHTFKILKVSIRLMGNEYT